jgi:hypothetical protein
VEVVGDDLHVQESKDKQYESRHADESEHNQDEARESVGGEVSRATWQPSALCGRFGGHPIRIVPCRLGLRVLRCAPRASASATLAKIVRYREPDPIQDLDSER